MANNKINKSDDNIPELVPGDENVTMLHSSFANRIIKRVNALWNSHGANGIEVKKSDSNVVYSYNPDKKKDKFGKNNVGGSNGSGSISTEHYKFEWNPDSNYNKYDMVRVLPDKIYTSSIDPGVTINSTPGVFICTENIISNDPLYYPVWPEPLSNCYWNYISGLPTKMSVCEDNVVKYYYIDSSLSSSL